MKRKVWFIISLTVLVVLFITLNSVFLSSQSTGSSVVEAVQKSGRNVTKVVYTEEVKDGAVVFYKKSIGNGEESIACGYVKKTLWGWEWVWGGEHSDPGLMGFSAQYFPYTKDTPFPLAFGEIKDQQIKHMDISKNDKIDVKEAKIVETGTDSLWYIFLDQSEGSNFTITGLSSEGIPLYSETLVESGLFPGKL